jgi:hypothetical protein
MTSHDFVNDLERFVSGKLAVLDLLKEEGSPSGGYAEIVRRLKIALKSELEASELAAFWMRTTPEVDVKLGLARQAGDEARHYRLIEEHLTDRGIDLSGFDPSSGGYGPMFELLTGFQSTVERVAAAQFARESLALKKNEQFIEFCEALGDTGAADLYRNQIQKDEQWHVNLGRTVLEKYATSPELQSRARRAVEAVLDLAITIQNKQLKEMNVSHAPGC